MTIAYWCVLIVILFPYFFTILAKFTPYFDNTKPREYLEKLSGWRKRAHYVQLNSFEINPAFMASVIIAHQLEAPQLALDKLAMAFVVSRIFYGIFYITNKASLRSISWLLGLGCVIGLFIISI